MFSILDRVLARFVPTATASAACTKSRYCSDCGQNKFRWVTRTCCLNEGCTYAYATCGRCA